MPLPNQERKRLAAILGMLGSEHAGERAAAALRAEEIRRKYDLTWDELLSAARVAPEPPPPSKEEPRPQPPPPNPETRHGGEAGWHAEGARWHAEERIKRKAEKVRQVAEAERMKAWEEQIKEAEKLKRAAEAERIWKGGWAPAYVFLWVIGSMLVVSIIISIIGSLASR